MTKELYNTTLAVFLINDKVRMVSAVYTPDSDREKAKRYHFKTMVEDLKVGDMVLVGSDQRHNLNIAQVVEVDVDVDFQSCLPYKWAYYKLDMAPVKMLEEQESEALRTIERARRRRMKEELRKDLVDLQEDEIRSLQIADLSNGKVEEEK